MSTSAPSLPLLSPLDSALGAVVNGLDVSRPVAPATILALKQGLRDHHILIFENQDLTEQGLKAFATYFGSVFQPPPEIPVPTK